MMIGGLGLLVAIGGFVIVLYGRRDMHQTIEEQVRKQLETAHSDLRARLQGQVGYIFGEMRALHTDPETQKRLSELIVEVLREAYDRAPAGSMKLILANNLAFEMSVLGRKADAPTALACAHLAKEQYGRDGDLEWLLTYGAVALRYASEFGTEARTKLEEAKTLLSDVAMDPRATARQRELGVKRAKEVEAALAALDRRTS